MESGKPTASQVAIKWALFSLAASVILTYAFQLMNIGYVSPVRYVSMIPFILFMFLGQKEFRDKLGGFMKFGDGFMAGFLYAVFAGVMGAIFWYVYYRILNTSAYDLMLSETQAQLEAKGMSSDKVEATIDIYRKFGSFIFPLGAVLGSIFMGAIISLVGAAIFKKEPTAFDIEQAANNFSDPA